MKTKDLGLAAYMQMKGCTLEKVEDRFFYFCFTHPNLKERFKKKCNTLKEWEISYLNSCCHKHDSTLVSLRKVLGNTLSKK